MSLYEETMDLIPWKARFWHWTRSTHILADSRFANVEVTEKMFLLTIMSLFDAP